MNCILCSVRFIFLQGVTLLASQYDYDGELPEIINWYDSALSMSYTHNYYPVQMCKVRTTQRNPWHSHLCSPPICSPNPRMPCSPDKSQPQPCYPIFWRPHGYANSGAPHNTLPYCLPIPIPCPPDKYYPTCIPPQCNPIFEACSPFTPGIQGRPR